MTITSGNTHPVARRASKTGVAALAARLPATLTARLHHTVACHIARFRIARLAKLDDRQLADLGLTRTELRCVLNLPASEDAAPVLDRFRRAKLEQGL